MQTFRKKPVEIEAMQMPYRTHGIGDQQAQVHVIALWVAQGRELPEYGANYLDIETLEGTMTAKPGDWVIKGVQGEFYPCKPSIFEETYDAVR